MTNANERDEGFIILDGGKVKRRRVDRHWSQEQLYEASSVSLDTIRRIEKGGWRVQPGIASKLARALETTVKALEATVDDGDLIRHPLDFLGREKDQERIAILYRQLAGWYEVYHYAASKDDRRDTSIFLIHIKSINTEFGVIDCDASDANFKGDYFYDSGYITPVGNFLYFFFVATEVDALTIYCAHRPSGSYDKPVGDREAGGLGLTIYGIMLGLSGGVFGGRRKCPVAAKMALRRIGRTADEALKNSIVECRDGAGNAEDALRLNIGGYLSDLRDKGILKKEMVQMVEEAIVPNISNEVRPNDIPFVLRA